MSKKINQEKIIPIETLASLNSLKTIFTSYGWKDVKLDKNVLTANRHHWWLGWSVCVEIRDNGQKRVGAYAWQGSGKGGPRLDYLIKLIKEAEAISFPSDANIKTNYCPQCGKKVNIGDNYCPNCGKKLA